MGVDVGFWWLIFLEKIHHLIGRVQMIAEHGGGLNYELFFTC